MTTATRLGSLFLAGALALTACTGDAGADDDKDKSSGPKGETSAAEPAVEPTWSEIEIAPDSGPGVTTLDNVDDVIASY